MSDEATSEGTDENQLSPEFVAMLVCPESRKPLVQRGNRLLCRDSRKAYRIEDGIPILLIDEAERVTDAELAELG